MSINTIAIFLSCLSFYAYVASYFMSPHMKNEFKRFNLEKIGLITVGLEFLGATGLLVGLFFPFILTLSSLGLSLLMLCGLIVRIQSKDNLMISVPAGFYMLLNAYIFYLSLGSLLSPQ